jgi:predicted alpha/beta superfamily hydrolase
MIITKPLLRGRLHPAKPLKIAGFEGDRRITLYLPHDYDTSQRRYPVAYMWDGQNLFGDQGSFAGGWHLHQALDMRATHRKTVPIIVSIHHGPKREEELVPWPVNEGGEAKADLLLDWLTGTLMPMVEKDLRVLTGPEHTMVGGSSLGGLMSLYAFFRHNETFGKALCMSPSLWVAEGKIFEYVAKAACTGDPRLYLDCGAKEANGIVIEHAEWMAQMLDRKGFWQNHHYYWRPDPRGDHNERAWRRRLHRALHFLYG